MQNSCIHTSFSEREMAELLGFWLPFNSQATDKLVPFVTFEEEGKA